MRFPAEAKIESKVCPEMTNSVMLKDRSYATRFDIVMPAPKVPLSQFTRFNAMRSSSSGDQPQAETVTLLRIVVLLLAILPLASSHLKANGGTFATSSVNSTGNLQYLHYCGVGVRWKSRVARPAQGAVVFQPPNQQARRRRQLCGGHTVGWWCKAV